MPKKLFLVLALLFSFVLLSRNTALAAAPKRSNVVWVSSNKNGVVVTPYVDAGKKSITIDFDGFNNNMLYVYYDLNYKQKDGNAQRVFGSFVPGPNIYNGWYNGKPFYRITIPFGTCSGSVCVYHGAKDLTLKVNTKMKSGAQYTNWIFIPNDQF